MEHSWILMIAMLGHVLCVYADRLLLCTPGGQFSFSDMKDNRRMAKHFAAKPESESDGTDATSLKYEKIINGMKNHTAEEIEAALIADGFSGVRSDHHPSKPWITVLARK